MTHLLPPNLLKLFAPRPPLPYKRPVGRDVNQVRSKNVFGVAAILAQIQEENQAGIIIKGKKEETEEGEELMYSFAEETLREMRREQRKKQKEENFKLAKESYKPSEDAQAVGDPYKTLFISRLSKNASESDVRRQFEQFGPLERVRVVRDKKDRSRGYAFLVYERERDMKGAYKEADGMVILGKKILVDVERGRTVRGWKPRRLGGGLGGRPKPEVAPPALSGRGGIRGGGGGGGEGGGRGGGFRGGRGGGFGSGGGGGGGGRGFSDRGGRGGFRGGFTSDRGYAGRGGGGGGGFRGRGGGIGFQGNGGFSDGPPNGYGGPPPSGGPPGGYGGSGGYGGGHGGYSELKREGSGGHDDRDAKRPRRY